MCDDNMMLNKKWCNKRGFFIKLSFLLCFGSGSIFDWSVRVETIAQPEQMCICITKTFDLVQKVYC